LTPFITLNDFSTVLLTAASCLHILSLLTCFIVFSVFSVVLTAAVTQASLQSMLHKILTAGPSAFNITTLLSQATQLSSQGKHAHTHSPRLCNMAKKSLIIFLIFSQIRIMI